MQNKTPAGNVRGASLSYYSRREFLRRSIVGGTLMFASSGLVSGCWPFGDDDDDSADTELTPEAIDDETPEPSPDPDPTPTPEAQPTATPEPTPTPDLPPEPQVGGELVIALEGDPWSLHPNADESVTNWMVIAQIHDALVEVDLNFEVVPVLAESFEVRDDGRQYVFNLRSGVQFHNGRPLTAEDVRYTHEWMSNPENAPTWSFYYERVERVEAPDDGTVVFEMERLDGTVLRRAATAFIVNQEYHEEFGGERHSLEPIGTGPFRLRDWVRGESLRLEAFDDYFDGRPMLDRIEFRVMTNASSRLTGLRNGTVDAAYGLDIEDAQELAGDEDFTSLQVTDLDCNHLALNTDLPLLVDSAVRRAMSFAIDRREIIDQVFSGAAEEARSYLSPALENWQVDVMPSASFDADRAIELLEGAGWVEGGDGIRTRNGQRLALTCFAPEAPDRRADQAAMMRAMLAEVGIELNVVLQPSAETLQAMRDGSGESALFNWTFGGWRGEPDGRTVLLTGAFNNFYRYSSIQVDTLLANGVSAIDEGQRRQIYQQIQQHVADQCPLIPILFRHSWFHFGPRVHGLVDSAAWGSRIFRLTPQFWLAG